MADKKRHATNLEIVNDAIRCLITELGVEISGLFEREHALKREIIVFEQVEGILNSRVRERILLIRANRMISMAIF